MRGDEDDVGLPAERPRRLDAVHPGHADVQEDDIGLQALHEGHRLAAVGCLAHDQEFGPGLLERGGDLVAHQALVVGDNGGWLGDWRHAGSGVGQVGAEAAAIS